LAVVVAVPAVVLVLATAPATGLVPLARVLPVVGLEPCAITSDADNSMAAAVSANEVLLFMY
jgi:hypothetical protein